MGLRVHQNVVIFDRDDQKEKQAEAIAVGHAVVYGHCEKCGFLKSCDTNNKFQPPVFAWCQQKKKRIMDGWNRNEESGHGK